MVPSDECGIELPATAYELPATGYQLSANGESQLTNSPIAISSVSHATSVFLQSARADTAHRVGGVLLHDGRTALLVIHQLAGVRTPVDV